MNANSYASPASTGGNREDLRGALYYVEPENFPFTSMLRHGQSPKSTLVEHMADTYRKPRISGTREGSSTPKGGNKATKRQRFGSYLHRFYDSFGVTDVQQLLSQNGGNATTSNEYGWAKAKAVIEVKRDIESVFLSHQDGQGGSDDEMRSRGAFKWLEDGSTVSPTYPSDFQPPAEQQQTSVTGITETIITTALKSLTTNYGVSKEYPIFMGTTYMENTDDLTLSEGSATDRLLQINAPQNGTIDITVKQFKSSFGTLNFILDLFLDVNTTTGVGLPTAALIANMDLWEALWLDDLHSEDDPEDAGGMSGYVKGIGGLFCKNPKGNAFIVNSFNN